MVAALLTLQIPADKWKVGGVASSILTVCSVLVATLSTLVAGTIGDFFLPTATGNGLKALAYYTYGVTVADATFATGTLTLTNTGGGVYTKASGEFTCLNPTIKQTYVNSDAFTLAALETKTINIRAVNAGSVANSDPGTITQSVTSLLGVTISNPIAVVGLDAPSDEAVRQECVNRLAVNSVRGVRFVYAYAVQTAINPATLGPVNINRWAISEASHMSEVVLYIAAPSGTVDPNDLTGVETNIEATARPSGVEVSVIAATPLAYAPAVTVYALAAPGTTQAQIKTSIDDTISTFIAQYPIGGITASDDSHPAGFTGLFGEGVTGAISKGCNAIGATLLSVKGATDLALTSSQVAADGVATTVVIVSPVTGVLL